MNRESQQVRFREKTILISLNYKRLLTVQYSNNIYTSNIPWYMVNLYIFSVAWKKKMNKRMDKIIKFDEKEFEQKHYNYFF